MRGPIVARAEELGTLLSREEGKPLAEGKGEVYRAGQFFTYYAAECLRLIGENADSVRPDIEIDVRREPVGTVAVISSWMGAKLPCRWKGVSSVSAMSVSVRGRPVSQTRRTWSHPAERATIIGCHCPISRSSTCPLCSPVRTAPATWRTW